VPERPCQDPIDRAEVSLDTIIPSDSNKAYDMHDVIRKVFDMGHFYEIQPDFAKNIVIGFARLNGRTVGYVL